MARQRSPKWDIARQMYVDSGGQKQLKDIAAELEVSPDQVRKWKKEDKKKGVDWDALAKGHVTNETNGHVTNEKPEKRSAPAPPHKGKQSSDPDEDDDRETLDLTPKQRLFVAEFLIDLNATQAAIRAGYSAKNADKIGSELLGKTRVREAIEAAMREREKRTQVTSDYVVGRLLELAEYDARDFASVVTEELEMETKKGPVKLVTQNVLINENFDGKIAMSISKGKEGIKIELPDRVRVLELLGKHTGAFDSHKRRIDERRLELDAQKLEIEKAKAQAKVKDTDDMVIKVKLPEVNIDADD